MQDLPNIINWRRFDTRITTSGQPTETQLADIRDLGISRIINLGPHHNKGALPDERGTVTAMGLEYIYIPVEFEAPTDADFALFCAALEKDPDAPVHVHCIYNARVSAFFYRYAKTAQWLAPDDVFKVMDGIWRPGADWAEFIDSKEAASQPNRYAGDDY